MKLYPEGKEILTFFNKYKKLHPSQQQKVANFMVDNAKKVRDDNLSILERKDLAKAIVKFFPGENVVSI